MARINRDDVDKLYDYDLYIPSRTIYMGSCSVDENGESGVDAVMAERVIKALHLLDQKNEPITIIMNNPGGDWYHGMAIYDAIKECQSEVTVKVKGMAMSMGSIILQAADNRVMSPNSRFMIHYGYSGGAVLESSTSLRWADEEKKIRQRMEEIYMEKIKEKHPNFPIEKLQSMLNPDTILSADETVGLGLADEVS